MKILLNLSILFSLGLFVSSFTKYKATEESNGYIQNLESRHNYIEFTCTTNGNPNRAGTMCVPGLGYCKKVKECTAAPPPSYAIEVPSICATYANQMVSDDFIDSEDWSISYQICIESLNAFYFP